MKTIRGIEYQAGSKEENLPYDTPDFPYLASRAELNSYPEPFAPWHWHNAIELFYMKSGRLNYYTPHKNLVFPAGSAGMVNANVLHKTQVLTRAEDNIQLLHIFDPLLLAGSHGSLIEQKYISPIVTASQIELIALSPDEPEQAAIIDLIRSAFTLSEQEPGYEFKIREALSRIWIELFQMCAPLLKERSQTGQIADDKVKGMMVYVHEHYAEISFFVHWLAQESTKHVVVSSWLEHQSGTNIVVVLFHPFLLLDHGVALDALGVLLPPVGLHNDSVPHLELSSVGVEVVFLSAALEADADDFDHSASLYPDRR